MKKSRKDDMESFFSVLYFLLHGKYAVSTGA